MSRITDSPSSIAQLAYDYESTLSRQTAKHEGIFYTPEALASKMVARALHLICELERPAILDPSCGAGVFLLAIIEKIATQKCLQSERLADLITTSIYGVDRDPEAVDLARSSVMKLFLRLTRDTRAASKLERKLEQNLVCADSLILEQLGRSTEDKWAKMFPDVFQSGGFALVIGNPPYGLARDGKLSPEENNLLRDNYSRFISGKINKYLLFMGIGTQILRHSGVLSFVVPNAWLGIRDGQALRQHLLRSGSLLQIDRFEEPIFLPSVETIVMTWRKNSDSSQIEIQNFEAITSAQPKSFSRVSVAECLSDPECRIPVTWSETSSQILRKIILRSTPIKEIPDIFQPLIAIQAYAVGRGLPAQTKATVASHPFHSEEKIDESYYPYFEGRDVGRYQLKWSGQYLSHGPWLAEPQNIERFTGPRIVLREILGRKPYLFQAALIDSCALYNKSILHIILGKNGTRQDLCSLLALLNSKVGSFILLQLGRKSQRSLFPKIVNGDLKDFPYPIELPEKISEATVAMSTEATPETKERLSSEIDRMIYEFFELNSTEVAFLENAVG